MTNFLITIGLIGLVLTSIYTILKLFTKEDTDRLQFIKTFKRGKFSVVFLFVYILYFVGILNSQGESVGVSLLLAVKSTVEIIVLKIDYASIASFFNASLYYHIVMYICFVIVILNAFLFVLSFLGFRSFNFLRLIKIKYSTKKTYVIIGNNIRNCDVISSIKDGNIIFLIDSEKEGYEKYEDYCFIKQKAFILCNENNYYETINKRYTKNKSDNFIVIINLLIQNENADSKTLILLKKFADRIEEDSLDDENTKTLNIYAFGDKENETAYTYFVEKTNGCIHYINRHKLIALDFIDRFPLTKFMDSSFIDYNTATLTNDFDINVLLIGFGKTNQEIFLSSIANNQFVTIENNEVVNKKVNYYIYDKKNSENDKNLNHNYYRFEKEFDCLKGLEDKYLEYPDTPGNVTHVKIDINDFDFYLSIKSQLLSSKVPYNYVVIAFGSDLENIDLGEKLMMKMREWSLENNTKIFVKIRDHKLFANEIFSNLKETNQLFLFGNEKDIVYNISKICNEPLQNMALLRHKIYTYENEIKNIIGDNYQERIVALNNSRDKINEYAMYDWYERTQIERDSNIYAGLSVRLKLNMLGLDYTIDTNEEVSDEQYFALYDKNNSIDYYDVEYEGKRIVNYPLYVDKKLDLTPRNVFAIQEHLRWNAFMISSGIVPSTIEEIKNDMTVETRKYRLSFENNEYVLKERPKVLKHTNGKNYLIRKHGNLTTFNGLNKFAHIIFSRDYPDVITKEEKEQRLYDIDVIKYDFQLMDDVIWFLNKSGYRIIKKDNKNACKKIKVLGYSESLYVLGRYYLMNGYSNESLLKEKGKKLLKESADEGFELAKKMLEEK